MQTVDDLHPQAMDLAELAFLCRRRGEEAKAKELFAQALELEQKAASILPPTKETEPSRSILFRSAASLAYNAGDYETADWLISNGLSGFPPPEIKEELKNLYDDANFMRHLSLKGIELSNDQWVMSISGNSTRVGSAFADQLLFRIDKMTSVFYRTIERLYRRPYRTKGGISKEIKDKYPVLINAFIPGSFCVSFQLGYPERQLPLPGYETEPIVEPDSVIREVIECFEILESANPSSLEGRIGEQFYYENFVGLAKQIAPDGNDIRLVSLTHVENGVEQRVNLRKSRQQLRDTPELTHDGPQEGEIRGLTITGIIRHADSPENKKYGTVSLTESTTKRVYRIRVPIALMKDVVQPYFEESVTVLAYEKGRRLLLQEIYFAP